MAAVSTWTNARDFSGATSGIRPAPEWVDAEVLGIATNVNHNVPAGANFVVFSSTGPFYAKPNAAAVVPVGSITDGSASELNPTAWNLRPQGLTGQGSAGTPITAIGLISAAAQTVVMTFYKIDRPGG